jgi:DNA replication protein DnaC
MRSLTNYDLARANIPKRYWDARFDEIPDTAPYKVQLARYMRSLREEVRAGKGLFITHPRNGTGKTGIACLIGKRALKEGFTVYYVMCEPYKKAVVTNQMFDEYQLVEERARSVDVLILDDFGKEFKGASGWIESELENLVRERTQNGRASILTSNVLPNDIANQFGEDLASVLRESVYIMLIPGAESGGKNWREDRALGVLGPVAAAANQTEEDW